MSDSFTKNNNGSETQTSSAGSGITTAQDAATDVQQNSSQDSTNQANTQTATVTSPLLNGEMTFEELIGEICNGIDLCFIVKRSTVVVTDYESLYAEAKYLRDNHHDAIANEDIGLWQLEDGSYELDVAEYGFYNTVKVNYKNGTVVESYDDLVRVYSEVPITYDEPEIDKTTAIMKAKAYLAAHVRDFDMTVKATLLHDADIDIGDIVTIDNPMTLRDAYKKLNLEKDPEYFFVKGNSIEWEGEGPILNNIELRYGAESPERKEVPEVGASYSGSNNGGSSSSSGDVDSALQEVGQLASQIRYSGACQTHDCVQQKKVGDCHGMSDYIACELKSRGVNAKIYQYGTAYASNHRSVKYQDQAGNWVRFPYRQYNVDYLFRDTDGVEHGTEIGATCG